MSERTFAPTGRHLAEMRERGDVALSPDLTMSIGLLVAVYYLGSHLSSLLGGLEAVMRRTFANLATFEITPAGVTGGWPTLIQFAGSGWLNFIVILMVSGVVATLVQTRGLVAVKRAKPDFSRLNPASGIKRIFSKQSMFETGKGIFKMAVLGVILYQAVRTVPDELSVVTQSGVGPAVVVIGNAMASLAKNAALWLLLTAGVDYAFQSRQFSTRSKMTREEVQEEMKNSEGQPQVKQRIRQLMRRMSRARMMEEIVHADVVVTNPTHLAIALKYDSVKMAAPVVLAKGKGLIAAEIVKRAKEHNVPIVQNIPLAHALIHVELEAAIPADLYQAVAAVLAFVYRLKAKGTQTL
jgi:flagellar biosynthesis protein FlhB